MGFFLLTLWGADRAIAEDALVVATSGDYAPFSVASDPADGAWGDDLTGFGPAVARAYARDRGVPLRFVPFRWPELLADLEAGRFDLAIGGITVRPERSIAGRFTVPIAESGAVLLAPRDLGGTAPSDFDRPGLKIGVNAGGHLERVARATFDAARIEAIGDNGGVIEALALGRVDAVVTDTREAPHWRARVPDSRLIGPFTRDRKAVLLPESQAALADDLDRWLLSKEADGTLAALRARYLNETEPRSAGDPALGALFAALDERLALMPLVAEAKRKTGAPIDVPEREQLVLDAAVAGVQRALVARDAHGSLSASRSAAVRALFRAQIEAAKSIQRRTLAAPAPANAPPPPDLAADLRPALIRIGDRIAALLVDLPDSIDPQIVRERGASELANPALDPASRRAIVEALVVLLDADEAPEAAADPPVGQ